MAPIVPAPAGKEMSHWGHSLVTGGIPYVTGGIWKGWYNMRSPTHQIPHPGPNPRSSPTGQHCG